MARWTRKLLLTPGPTPLHPRVQEVLGSEMIHHRTERFSEIMGDARAGLAQLFGTDEVLVLASTGTGAMDATVSNLFSRGDTVMPIVGGKFGARWGEIADSYRLRAETYEIEWGTAPEPEEVERRLVDNQKISAVLTQAVETSTGAAYPIRELADVVRRVRKQRDTTRGPLLVVDGISAVGTTPLPMDDWGIDVLMTGSQKGLMLPPGLAFVALSDRAWQLAETSNLPNYYLDLQKERKRQTERNQTAYTSAVSLVRGLRVALDIMLEEGLDELFERHAVMAKAARAAVTAMGLELLAPTCPASALTSARIPESVDGSKLPQTIEDRYGVRIAGGQKHLKGKIFRLAHMGYVDPGQLMTGLWALERALRDLGANIEPGSGLAAAEEVFSSS